MAAIRWGLFLLAAECLVCLVFTDQGLWSFALAAVFFLLFLIFGWTFRTPRTYSSSRKASS